MPLDVTANSSSTVKEKDVLFVAGTRGEVTPWLLSPTPWRVLALLEDRGGVVVWCVTKESPEDRCLIWGVEPVPVEGHRDGRGGKPVRLVSAAEPVALTRHLSKRTGRARAGSWGRTARCAGCPRGWRRPRCRGRCLWSPHPWGLRCCRRREGRGRWSPMLRRAAGERPSCLLG